jgi:hypothetical protein
MRSKVARGVGLAGLGVGMLAVACGGVALASPDATADTGGTAAIAIQHSVVKNLAKAGIVVLPTGAGTATYVKAKEKITLKVSGGDATFVGTTGTLELSGGLQLIDGATGKSVTLTKLAFSYDSNDISGVADGREVAVGQVSGSLNGTQNAGPPASETFTATGIYVTKSGARFLDSALHASYFKAGADLGSFAATYDVQTAG